jgi:hypothetical protein
MAQYSHFPLTQLEVDGIESQKYPNFTSELETFDDIIDPSIFDSGTALDFHSDLIKSPSSLEFLNTLKIEPMDVGIGISHNDSLKRDSNLAYIQNLPDAETIISPDSPDLISHIIYFLKDLFDDGNYSEDISSYTLKRGNEFTLTDYSYFSKFGKSSIDNTSISSLFGTYLNTQSPKVSGNESSSRTSYHYAKTFSSDSTPQKSHKHEISKLSSNAALGVDFIHHNSPLNVFDLESYREESRHYSSRQRRANFDHTVIYKWEIKDFDKSNTSGYDKFILDDFNATLGTFQIEIVSLHGTNGTVNTGNYGLDTSTTNFGVPGSTSPSAGGMYSGNSFNSYTGTNGFHFLTVNGTITGTPNFSINSDSISYYLGHWYGDWGVHQDDEDFYITYSAAPEPSTYVMTGALLCFIGFNQKSRKSLKKIFNLLSNKLNLPSYLEKLTKSQSHS